MDDNNCAEMTTRENSAAEGLVTLAQNEQPAGSGPIASVALVRVHNMVEAAYIQDVEDTISGRFYWRKLADYAEVMARTLSGVSAVLAFAAGTYDITALSFAAGAVQTSAMVLGLWVSYANKESRERARELNAVLRSLGVQPLPDLASFQAFTNAMNVYNKA